MATPFYIYIHYKKDDGQPFYVGKGKKGRAYRVSGRSIWWNRIVAKHGLIIEIINYFVTEQEAFNREKSIIASMRAAKIELCNMTNGGDGTSGLAFSNDHRNKISIALSGLKRSEEYRNKVTGSGNHAFKGQILATNIKNNTTIILNGNKHMRSLDFNPGCVSRCITGKRKTYKGFTFKRIII